MSRRPNPPNTAAGKPGYWYGNATSLVDGAGVEYIAGIAAYDGLPQGDPARFRFSVYRVNAGSLTYLPLEDEGSGLGGAGNIYVRNSDGTGRYGCTSGKVHYDGPIPGFVPLPPLLGRLTALEGRVAALQAQIVAFDAELTALAQLSAGSPPTMHNGVLTIPAQSQALEGGEIRIADGMGGWIVIDGRAGHLRVLMTGAGEIRFFVNGVVVENWKG